ncbi:mannan endo-1,4-beta-mannosidase [Flavobacterium noncentrifugens]|uniref:Mannan endo-1,4-beta-mannosidase n=1 Tax=Flavobacterium noncentrifugens TaxID=1128970 RepID=A0A1G8WII7_9FLAO|nr:glycosyl hydrolase [Flavobacterium noncentrifugens]GEP50922.1 mannan endo-1,4-beta-mannosidase [Flavobacterium noncentrifugens]SDJ77380.1 mannan endo-1,4-beta-mannosidase [Flavobacterium noncentrifugens]
MTKTLYYFFLTALIASCSGYAQVKKSSSALSDPNATPETVVLYNNLKKFAQKGIMFGHQDDLAYGVNWKYEPGRSDVKDVTGDYPAVYGWDLGGLEKKSDKNIDGIPFDKMREFIKDARKRGGIVTISWHTDNPLTAKNAWDTTPKTLVSILPGGQMHEKFKGWLDEAAKYLNSLKDANGKPIPVLYRPYHELTGNWFWWCKNNASPEDFKSLWKFTLGYLQSRGVHNLIYVYNTSDFKTREEFLEYYPGAGWADVLSFDNYQYKDPATDNSFIENCQRQFGTMDAVAKEQNKLTAFAETGYEQIPYNKWWTQTLLQAIGNYKISYVLVWRNHGWNEYMNPPRMHYYAPYKGQSSEKDFVDFYNLSNIFFEKDAAAAKLYTK